MGAFWDTEDGKELMATLPPYEGRKKTREDMRKASTDPTPISKLAQQLEAEMYARLEAQKNAPAPAPEIPDSPLPAGSAVQAVKKRTKRRDPPPANCPAASLRDPVGGAGLRLRHPFGYYGAAGRQGAPRRVLEELEGRRAAAPFYITRRDGAGAPRIHGGLAGAHPGVRRRPAAQFGTVRVPIVGWVDAPQGGPCGPNTVTES